MALRLVCDTHGGICPLLHVSGAEQSAAKEQQNDREGIHPLNLSKTVSDFYIFLYQFFMKLPFPHSFSFLHRTTFKSFLHIRPPLPKQPQLISQYYPHRTAKPTHSDKNATQKKTLFFS